MAWRNLPSAHRTLLESIGASQWQVVSGPLGTAADGFLQSAGHRTLARSVRDELNRALGLWIRELRIVLINDSHPKLIGLNAQTCEEFIARVAWHEWGHALSIARCSSEDVAAGSKLLKLAPEGIQKRIRYAGYGRRDYTHEVIAETYALLMVRRLTGGSGQPSWLDDEIYDLLKRVTEWSD
jgi:hypothetical protein